MRIFPSWSDLSEFWSDLFDNPLHSVYAVGVCFVVVLVAIVVVLRLRPAEARKLAWRVFLASAALYVAIVGPWANPALDWSSWVDLSIGLGVAAALLVILFVANYWCLAVLLAWRYKNENRHSWHVWAAWLSTTGWTLWLLLILRKQLPFITGGHFLWIPPVAAFVGVILGEAGFSLKADRRPVRIALLGCALFSMSVVAGIVTYKIFHPSEPAPYVYVDRTNATVRAGALKAPFELKYIAACRNPSDTLLWIDIAKGGTRSEHPRTVDDFQAQYSGECGFYVVDRRDTVEGPAVTFGGVDMLCIKDLFNTNVCHWIPAQAIELDPPVLER